MASTENTITYHNPLCLSPRGKERTLWKFAFISMNPFKPDDHTQILKTDLHAFPSRISRENLIRGTKHFPFGDYVLFILTILSLDDELLLSEEN